VPARAPVPQSTPPGVDSPFPVSGGVSGHTSPKGNDPLLPRFYHSNASSSSSNVGSVLPASVWGEDDTSMHDRSVPQTKVAMLNIGEYITPLFCVSVNEHAWMAAGYGVWGKEEWLKKFWTVLDWQKLQLTFM